MKRVLSVWLATLLLAGMAMLAGIPTAAAPLDTNGNGGKTDVGAWFVTYNTEKMWANNFGNGIPIKYRVLMPDGSYGIPDSLDDSVIDFQLEQLAQAQVDFILFDLTNGGLTEKIPYGWGGNNWITDSALQTCARIREWNATHDWKLRYAVAVGVYANLRGSLSIGEAAEYQSEGVWDLFYSRYQEEYYTVEGKPLMVLHDFGRENPATIGNGWNNYVASSMTDHDSGERFTMRGSLSTPKEDTGISWYTPTEGTIVTEEAVTVSPGQWNHSNTQPNKRRNNGQSYINDWKTVLNSSITPGMVLIASFNDYNEDTAVFSADTSGCDPNWTEPWYDDTGALNPSMYWEITKEGIARLRQKNGDGTEEAAAALIARQSREWLSDKPAGDSDSGTKTGLAAAFAEALKADGSGAVAKAGWVLAGFVAVLLAAAVIIVTVALKKPR